MRVTQPVYTVRTARIDIGKAYEFIGIFGDTGGGCLVTTLDADAVAIAQRKHDSLVHIRHFRNQRVGIGLWSHLALADTGQLLVIQRQNIGIIPDVNVAITGRAAHHSTPYLA